MRSTRRSSLVLRYCSDFKEFLASITALSWDFTAAAIATSSSGKRFGAKLVGSIPITRCTRPSSSCQRFAIHNPHSVTDDCISDQFQATVASLAHLPLLPACLLSHGFSTTEKWSSLPTQAHKCDLRGSSW